MSWLLLGAALASVETVTHDGAVVGDRLEWVSNFHGDGRVCTGVLPTDTVVKGRVADGMACNHRHVEVHRSQTLGGPLTPPLTPAGVHRITVRGSYITPDPSLGLTKTAGGWTDSGVTRLDRTKFDSNLLRHGPRKLRRAIYLRNPRLDELPVEYAESAVSPMAPFLMGGALLGVLLLGGLTYRSLDRFARKERIEAWLDDDAIRGELHRDGIR